MTMRDTSIAAYNAIRDNGLLSHRRMQVYEYIYRNGPCTTKAVTDYLTAKSNLRSDSFRPRFAELEKMGVLKTIGETTCKQTGRYVLLWDVTSELPKPLEKRNVDKTANDQVSANIATLMKGLARLPLQDRKRIATSTIKQLREYTSGGLDKGSLQKGLLY